MKDMKEDTIKNLELLARRMKIRMPVLFTGAGFSFGAKNAHGVKLPLSSGLKDMLIDEFMILDSEASKELKEESLSTVYSVACDKMGAEQAASYLTNIFRDCIPLDHHRVVASYPWRRIYTLNIDDLLENAVETGYLFPIDSARMSQKPSDKAIDYIKLHGSVRNREAGYIFSNEEYTRATTGHLDVRYARLMEDLQTEDFVFIGATTTEEADIDYYLHMYNEGGDSRHGGFFYVDPKPRYAVRSKIEKAGAHLLEMTCEEFAEWLRKQMGTAPRTTPRSIGKSNFIRNFLNINSLQQSQANVDYPESRLYLGEQPQWQDIFNDWDFTDPRAARISADIEKMLENYRGGIVVAISSKAMGGKSVMLKRLGQIMLSHGHNVVHYVGNDFNQRNFREYAANLPGETVVLLVDDAASYYNPIARIVEEFTPSKRLVIITTSRLYYHFKKHYDLKHLPGYRYYNLDNLSKDDMSALARSAVDTLKKKLLLGPLAGKEYNEQVRHFMRKNDIAEALWDINEGEGFRRKLQKSFGHVIHIEEDGKAIQDVLCALAIFNKADLPYMPKTLLTLWKPGVYRRIEKSLVDLTKPMIPDGLSLRTNILLPSIMDKCPQSERARIVRELLLLVAPMLGAPTSYWNQIQSRLMNVRFLHKILKIEPRKIKEILNKLGPSYKDNPPYLVQLAIIEQGFDDYAHALNHLQQAEQLSARSYNISNAIARNYLRRASRDREITREVAQANYEIGRDLMVKLIDEREQYQVRAYSVHSLVTETVSYWNRYGIKADAESLKELIGYIEMVFDKATDDSKVSHTCQILRGYIKRHKLTGKLPKFNLESLAILHSLMGDDEVSMFLEDDDLDF